jgi:hypothetical protein
MHTCEHTCPPHACAVMPRGGGGYCTLSLAWDGAVMMPLQGLGVWTAKEAARLPPYISTILFSQKPWFSSILQKRSLPFFSWMAHCISYFAWEWYHWIGLEKDINRYRFLIFIFDLEYFLRVLSSELLHAKMNPTSCLFRSLFACAQTAIFSAKRCSKNVGETSIVLWFTAHG